MTLTFTSALGPGEEWLVRAVGAYLPAVFEEVLDLVDAVILTEKVCVLGVAGKGPSGRERSEMVANTWMEREALFLAPPDNLRSILGPLNGLKSPPWLIGPVTDTWEHLGGQWASRVP